jgi:hypothetical protein
MTFEEISRTVCDILSRSGFNKEASEISSMVLMISTLEKMIRTEYLLLMI